MKTTIAYFTQIAHLSDHSWADYPNWLQIGEVGKDRQQQLEFFKRTKADYSKMDSNYSLRFMRAETHYSEEHVEE